MDGRMGLGDEPVVECALYTYDGGHLDEVELASDERVVCLDVIGTAEHPDDREQCDRVTLAALECEQLEVRPRLGPRARAVVEFVRAHQRQKGYPPTRREIQRALSFRNLRAVSEHIDRLEAEGYLQRDASKARGIVVIEARS
jgi:hypothetical protein